MEDSPVLLPPAGIILVDKPRGPSSHQVAAWVRDLLQVPVGHSGTLDPMVSGVLVVMLGRAVRLAPWLLQSEKEYICLMKLHGNVDPEDLARVQKEFTGRIYQRPPRRSAVKRSLRIRTIHALDILEVEGQLVLMRVHCDAGTYVRSLCHHMGYALGVGAHLQELRRTRSGTFEEKSTHTLQEIRFAYEAAQERNAGPLQGLILSPSAAVQDLPRVVIRDQAVDAICHGAVLARVGIEEFSEFGKNEVVAILTQKGELVGLGTALVDSTRILTLSSGLIVAPRVVIMERGSYPRGWNRKRVKKAE
ncbi:MAG: RNA-guided pseudouridylation complex pseudouridine synthase subunit Cbf5 [Methanomicrobiales archaeon]|nr:RNA-guided pseudouridylation complex pseudouridine synthase subunit Cbf5 [Methanomicrobiales archaeon]